MPMKPSTFVFVACLLSGCENTSTEHISWEDLSLSHDAEVYIYQDTVTFCQTHKKDPAHIAGQKVLMKPLCKKLKSNHSLESFKQLVGPAALKKKSYLFFNKPSAKATAYYTPLLKGSYDKTSIYKVPVRKKPKNLVQIHTSVFDESQKSIWIGMIEGQKIVPYFERAEIEQSEEDVLFYTDSLVDKFFLQVQGSGYVSFENGDKKLASFAAHNGKSYTSIGRVLVEEEELSLENANMFAIKTWLKNNPSKVETLLNTNERYIFFGWGKDVKGASKRTLEAYKSAAVDPRTMSYGLPFILNTTRTVDGTEQKYILRADDTGAAIRGVGRVDIYAGEGELSEKMAAYQNSDGEMVVFLPRPL